MNDVIRIASLALMTGASAMGLAAEPVQALKGEQAMAGWRQDEPGVRRLLTARDMPPVGKETIGPSAVVPMPAGAAPKVPDGFTVERVASGLNVPRAIRAAPNGDLFLAESGANRVRVLRLASGSGKPERDEVFAAGLSP